MNLIIRLTTGLDLIAVRIFLLLVLWLNGRREAGSSASFRRLREYAAAGLSILLLIDRCYQFYRFGRWTSTPTSTTSRASNACSDPDSARRNIRGRRRSTLVSSAPLITPEKSIFLFDPLIILTISGRSLRLEAFQPAGEGIHRRHDFPGCLPTSASMLATPCGAESLPGVTGMSQPRSKCWRSSRYRFCCGFDKIWADWSGPQGCS